MLEGSCVCGATRWRLDALPTSATACNCTACRRYGALWAYGHEGEDIALEGALTPYIRGDSLSFIFCARCGNLMAWRAHRPNDEGRLRAAVNLRMTEPGPVAAVPIDHFDGLDTFDDLPRDGKRVQDLWF